MSAKGIIEGVEVDGKKLILPDRSITRAEYIKILVGALGKKNGEAATASFTDVNAGHWAFQYVETAKKEGLVDGYQDGSFMPDAPITRAELTALLVRGYQLKEQQGNTVTFADVTPDFWGYSFIKTAASNKLIEGVIENGQTLFKLRHRLHALNLLSTFSADGKTVAGAVYQIDSSGGTNIFKGLKLGCEQFTKNGDPNHRWIAVLLTDGQDGGAPDWNAIQTAYGQGVTLVTMGLSDAVEKDYMEKMALLGGGQYFHVSTAQQLEASFRTIVDTTRHTRFIDGDNDGIDDYYEVTGMLWIERWRGNGSTCRGCDYC